jgi:hypothetical protein
MIGPDLSSASARPCPRGCHGSARRVRPARLAALASSPWAFRRAASASLSVRSSAAAWTGSRGKSRYVGHSCGDLTASQRARAALTSIGFSCAIQ